ncbi:MAG: hypothetical protein A3J54_03460 [Candidatus Ryanbacteria bacterium RIFCSPHIGHO2_02_FULL_45_13b]|uniref:Uncharacterized protein n=1 Tax=Candidatus Ryanbacteria bacterium RIFCSPHIGHO2_02_FULL_45_13b TaxID=1802117 RepID=A0A1G2GAU4_9BACT|nr:MAG: hypothetical protein A3J54_03460 [Candidatus Ryanbacteria bacterium RIFCSPHIGHO2_02_FULL_45_13b]
MRYILVIVLLFAIFIPFLTHAGIVPCGTEKNPDGSIANPCDLCDLYVGTKNIIDFLLFDFILPLAIVAFLIGGIFMLASSGNPQMLQTGKTAITNAVLGIFIAFGSWLIIATILNTLGYSNFTAAWNEPPICQPPIVAQPPPAPVPQEQRQYCVDTEGKDITTTCTTTTQGECVNLGGTWQSALPTNCTQKYCKKSDGTDATGQCKEVTKNSCDTLAGPTGTWDDSPPESCTGGSANALITQSLINNGVTFSSDSSCGGVHASTNKSELLASKRLTTCFHGCTPSSSCTPEATELSSSLLQTLDNVSSSLNFNITSLTTGNHGSKSKHYQGRAADLQPIGGSYLQLENKIKSVCGGCFTQCERGGGVVSCSSGTADHLHVHF